MLRFAVASPLRRGRPDMAAAATDDAATDDAAAAAGIIMY